MYELFEDQLKKMPEEEIRMQGEMVFNENCIEIMKQWAEVSPMFEDDWKADFVSGTDESLTMGLIICLAPVLSFLKLMMLIRLHHIFAW